MITWKTTEYIITARNPHNGLYGFDIADHQQRFIGSIIIRTPEEQKELFLLCLKEMVACLKCIYLMLLNSQRIFL